MQPQSEEQSQARPARRQLVHDIRNSLGTIMLDVHRLRKSRDERVVAAVETIEHDIAELRQQLEALFSTIPTSDDAPHD